MSIEPRSSGDTRHRSAAQRHYGHWTWLFIATCVFWALWGSWRVAHLGIEHIEPVGAVVAELRKSLPTAPLSAKLLFGLIFFVGTMLWAALPAWLFMFVNSMVARRMDTGLWGALLHASGEVLQTLSGLLSLALFWIVCTFLFAFLRDYVDLLFGLLMLTWLSWAVALRIRDRRTS
jgi:hypothetical protein